VRFSVIGFSLIVLCVDSSSAGSLSPERQKELRTILHQDCGSCHGLKLNGGLGPALHPENLLSRSDDVLLTTILKGRTGTPMPAWESLLSADDARWIIQELRTPNP